MRHLNGMKTRARLAQWTSVSVNFHDSIHRRKRKRRLCKNEMEQRKASKGWITRWISFNWVERQLLDLKESSPS